MNLVFEDLFPVQRLRWLARLRMAALLATALLVALAAWRIPALPRVPLLVTLVILAIIDGALLVYIDRKDSALTAQGSALLLYAHLAIDILGITLLLHFSGGVENPFFPFYVFPVMLAGAILSRTAARAFAALSSALYVLLVAGESAGWLPHYHLFGLQDIVFQRPAYAIGAGLALIATCFLAAEGASLLVGALRGRASELAESHRRSEVRAQHMRELNDQLRMANEDCRHSREHLDAVYLELAQAYSRLEMRSRHMSELNEQLRAANAECKSNREELAEVNQQLQEAYQRQEVRTEKMRELNEQLRVANAECKAQRTGLARLNEELAYANSKLRELDDARSQFTLLVTHELRAPVAAIQSYLKLILEGYVPAEKMTETLEKAERRALEQLALIADLLELGRIQGAEARGQVGPVQLEQALTEQLDLMAARAGERNLKIRVSVPPDLPPVISNMDQMRSVWNNLLSNAIKYNRDDGEIDILLTLEDDRLIASVRDTGIGIPPEAMTRLFSEFFRADNAKSVSRMGTGLGLSIVKEIIERSGGRIEAESELDKGTTLRFWLPVATAKDVETPAGELAA